MNDDVSDYEIADAMIRLGGAFMKRLGAAAMHADPVNLAKLRAAFPLEWNEYRDLARRCARA
jgi:hypothetical protein